MTFWIGFCPFLSMVAQDYTMELSPKPRIILLPQLVDTIKPILYHPKRPYTPLIVDASGNVDVFFTYAGEFGGLFIDAKKYLSNVLIQKTMTVPEALEEMRQTLVNALKYGKTLVLQMGNTALDFMHTFHGPDTFPVQEVLVEAGRRFRKEEYWSKVVRKEDRDSHGLFVCLPEFNVVVTSKFQAEEYQEFLESALPLNEMIPILIQQEFPSVNHQ
jgi:hypothetical protein